MKLVDAIAIAVGLIALGLAFASGGLVICGLIWCVVTIAFIRKPQEKSRIHLEVQVDHTLVEEGQVIQYRMSGTGQSRFSPGWHRHQLVLSGPNGPIDGTACISFGSGKSEIEALRRSSLDERGVYEITVTVDAAIDAFGLRKAEASGSTSTLLCAYPKALELVASPPHPHTGVGDRIPLRKIARQGQMPAGAREYQRGDSQRQIHWKLTAARGGLMTRISEAAVEPRYWLIWDVSKTQDSRMREVRARVAVTLAKDWLADRNIVGMWIHGSLDPRIKLTSALQAETGYFVTPKRDVENLESIRLAMASAQVIDKGIEHSLNAMCQKIQRGDVVIWLGSSLDEKAAIELQEMARRGATLGVIVDSDPILVAPFLPPGAMIAHSPNLEEARYLEFQWV